MTHEGRLISNAHIEVSRKRETLCESQKTVKRILPADGIVLSFFSGEEMKCASIPCSVVLLQGQNDESMTHPQ